MQNGKNLIEYLKSRPIIKDDAWLHQLESRKQEEAAFHDLVRDDETPTDELGCRDNLKFYKIVANSKRYVRDWLRRNVVGKVFLDYACGEGRHATHILERSSPRILIGLDISPFAVQQCIEKAKKLGCSDKAFFFQGDCENTELPDNSMDVILCSEMLHHLELEPAFKELYRICAPNGRIFCCEALGINPLIQWYRNKTPHMRTAFEKEHILTLKSLDIARSVGFTVEEIKFWHLFAIPAAFFHKYPLVFKGLLFLGNALDGILLKIPFIQRLAWQFTFILRKKA